MVSWPPVKAAAFEIVNARKVVPMPELISMLRERFNLGVAVEERILIHNIKGKNNEHAVNGHISTVHVVKKHPESGTEAKTEATGWAVILDVANAPAPVSQVVVPPTVEEKETQVTPIAGKAFSGLEGYIPDIKEYNKYIPRKMLGSTDVDIIVSAVRRRDHVLIIGPPGGGKTALTRAVCAKLQYPYIRNEGYGGAEVQMFIGQWIPVAGGGFRWQDGLLTSAVRVGGVYIQDEVNALPPELTFKVHSLLDDDRKITLNEKNNELVKAHEKFAFIGTMNEGTEGVREMNEAFRDRFHVILIFDYDRDVERMKIPHDTLREVGELLRQRLGQDLSMWVSTRGLQQFYNNISSYGLDAAKEFFIGKFKPEERAAVREIIERVTVEG